MCLLLLISSSVVYGQVDTLVNPTETASIKKKAVTPIIKKAVVVLKNINVDSIRKDSLLKAHVKDSLINDSIQFVFKKNIFLKDSINKFAYSPIYNNPFLGLNKKPIKRVMAEREFESKDYLFYLFVALFFLLALFKRAFQQYFNNVFRIFLQPSFRQLQTKDQMMQSGLASLFLNLFFFFTSSIYITFLIQYLHLSNLVFWQLVFYSFIAVSGLYLGKYLLLQLGGWIFGITSAMNTYIFIVFLLNKFVGIILFPIIIFIAFSVLSIQHVLFTTTFVLLAGVYLYRFLISYKPIKRDVKMNLLHFFLFVVAFEIAPLFLIYKVLMNFFK